VEYIKTGEDRRIIEIFQLYRTQMLLHYVFVKEPMNLSNILSEMVLFGFSWVFSL
jgi:hypothetical protein